MPYKFVDTIEHSSTETMPAEAMKINGEYIENQMDARYAKYRTLYVKGREMLSPEISSFETGVRNGSSFLSRRYPERVLTIGFTLQATSNYYFRMAWNELNRILNVENAEIIFYDEQDKFFTGTPAGTEEEPEPGTNFIKSEFNIICNDPFKYSILEYEVEPTEDNGTTFVVDYNGTYKCYPTLEAIFAEDNECGTDGSSTAGMTVDGDCGYVAWFNEDSKIIQLGDPNEEEGESYDKSQTLFSQDFRSISDWTSPLNAVWEKNYNMFVGISTTTNSCLITGTPGFPMMNSTEHYMSASDFGNRNGNNWYGPSVSREIPADATGDVGAEDWTLKWSQKLAIGGGSSANTQRGALQVIVTDKDDKVIAAANMFKGYDYSGSTGTIWFHVNGGVGRPGKTTKKVDGIDFSEHNARWGANTSTITTTKACSIVKSGTKVTFNLGGTTWSFTDSGLSGLKATRITINFLARQPYPTLTYMGVYKITFTKDNCTTWQDIPNKFTDNDTATAVCKSGTVLLNDAEAPEYGALGNNWEEFYLKPGINQIGFSYSEWCEKPPTTKMRYREVYL